VRKCYRTGGEQWAFLLSFRTVEDMHVRKGRGKLMIKEQPTKPLKATWKI
jgi:hypothetical protein